MAEFYEYEDITVSEVWENCVVPSVKDISMKITDLLVYNVLFSIMTQITVLPSIAFHSISFAWGFILLFSTIIEANIWHFLSFLLCTYVFIYIIHRVHIARQLNIEYVTGVACIAYLLLCEFLHPNQDDWMQSRGLFMVAAMKIISLSSDLQHGLEIPSLIAFFGYSCCPANSLFGPWIPFKEYVAIREQPKKKNFKWVLRIITTVSVSVFYLTVSNCWGSYVIPDDGYKWLVGYRQAQSFRTSHYFISYLSEAAMIAAGYSDEKHRYQTNAWGYQITNPIDIEVPTSLVSVVVSWNIPMHRFLKKYVYRACLQFGSFKAILATYLVSSLLHGFNVEIAAVLLTIGLYSYIQLKFQDKVSSEFNACLRVRPCKSCSHKYSRSNVCVKLAHVMFSFLTIFNLIYLGVLMDSVGYPDSPSVYSKWENLDFLSHWVMLAVHIFTII